MKSNNTRVRVVGSAIEVSRFHAAVQAAASQHPSELFSFTLLATNEQGEPVAYEYDATHEQVQQSFLDSFGLGPAAGDFDLQTQVSQWLGGDQVLDAVYRASTLLFRGDPVRRKAPKKKIMTEIEIFRDWSGCGRSVPATNAAHSATRHFCRNAEVAGIKLSLPEDTIE